MIKSNDDVREFETGSHRGNPAGKGRMDLLPAYSVLQANNIITDTEQSADNYDYKKYLYEAMICAIRCLECESTVTLSCAARAACIATGLYETSCAYTEDIAENIETVGSLDINGYFAYGLKQVSIHYEEGALKYGENNWKLGQPISVFLDSGLRHTVKAIAGITDEHHLRAAAWNYLCAIWTLKYKPEMNDITIEYYNN